MPYTYTLTSVIPATPQQVYDAWLDSVAHSEMTGSAADMSGEIGAEYSAWGDYITGRNLELVPGERIVQSWRTSKFGDEHADSVITVTLEGTDEGTLLTLVHSNVPDEQRNYEQGGWQSNYFEPMRAYFASLAQDEAEAEPAAAGPASAKSASKATRAAVGKTKQAAPPAKTRRRKTAKRAASGKVKAKPKPKPKRASAAKSTARKSAKRRAAKQKPKRR